MQINNFVLMETVESDFFTNENDCNYKIIISCHIQVLVQGM